MGFFLKFHVDDRGVLQYKMVYYKGKEIPYEVLRDEIGNIIQYVYHVKLGADNLAIVVDDEGLLKGLRPTFWLYDEGTRRVESYPLVGNVLVVKVKGPETVGLTEDDVKKVLNMVMYDYSRVGFYALPLNNDYIKKANNNLNEFFRMLNSWYN